VVAAVHEGVTTMESELRAALIAWLRADAVLANLVNTVSEEAPARASPPWLASAASASADWSTKDRRGREVRAAFERRLRGGDAGGGDAGRGAAAGAGRVRGGGGDLPARPGRAARGEPAGCAGGVSVSGFGGLISPPACGRGRGWAWVRFRDWPTPNPSRRREGDYIQRRTQMTAQKGSAFLLKVGDGGAYQTVAGLRTTQMSINGDTVVVTHKESGGWRELLSGAGTR